MKRVIPLLLSFAALVCINGAIVSAANVAPSDSTKPVLQIEKPYGGPTSTVSVSVTLVPGVVASLIYTDEQGLPTQIDFPDNAVTQTTTIVLDIEQGTSFVPGYIGTGHLFYVLGIQNGDLNKEFNFSAPVTITIEYSDSDIQQVPNEDRLTLYWWTGNNWIDATNTCTPATSYMRDQAANRISVPVCNSNAYGLFASYQAYLPLIAR